MGRVRRKRNGEKSRGITPPLFIERDTDGFYVVECPVLQGCYTQGKTMDEALENIREVIDLVLEEEQAEKTLKWYRPDTFSLHTITI